MNMNLNQANPSTYSHHSEHLNNLVQEQTKKINEAMEEDDNEAIQLKYTPEYEHHSKYWKNEVQMM